MREWRSDTEPSGFPSRQWVGPVRTCSRGPRSRGQGWSSAPKGADCSRSSRIGGSDEAAAEPVHGFFSRPDLRPPRVTVLRPASKTGSGLLFLAPSSGPGQRGALILDDAGEVVWFRPSSPDTTMDFRAGLYKGEPVLTWWEGRHQKGVGLRGAYVIVDTSYREIARFRSRDQLRPDFHEYPADARTERRSP